MLYTQEELKGFAEKLNKVIERDFGWEINKYVAIGVGNNKLCIYIQDGYFYTKSLVKSLEEKIKCFLTSQQVTYKINKVGKFRLN